MSHLIRPYFGRLFYSNFRVPRIVPFNFARTFVSPSPIRNPIRGKTNPVSNHFDGDASTNRPIDVENENTNSEKPKDTEREDGSFQLAPAALKRENFTRFLDCLKHRRPIPEWALSGGGLGGGNAAYKSILYTAPYLAEHFGLVGEFTNLVDEWFARVKQLFLDDIRRGELSIAKHFNSPESGQALKWKKSTEILFTIPHHLEYLGRLNKITKGNLAEKLGWENVSFLARRMAEIGFFTYTYHEVAGAALTGLRDLYETATTSTNATNFGGIQIWILAFAHFLAGSEHRPYDWRQLVDSHRRRYQSTIPEMLIRLSTLEKVLLVDTNMNPELSALFRYLNKLLCNYANIYFNHDIIDTGRLAIENGRISTELHVIRALRFLQEYASVWISHQGEFGFGKPPKERNPDFYVRDSWRDWYKAFEIILKQLLISDDFDRKRVGEHRSEENDYDASKLLNIHIACLNSPKTLRLLLTSLEATIIFDHTATFYEVLYETWVKALRCTMQRLGFDSTTRHLAFCVLNLMKIVNLDTKNETIINTDEEMQIESDEEDEKETNSTPISSKEQLEIRRRRRKESFDLALSLMDDIVKRKRYGEVPYRAMNGIVSNMVDWSITQDFSNEKKLQLFSEGFLEYLRNWCTNKRLQNASYNASNSSKLIRGALERLKLPRSELLNNVFSELDALHAIGRDASAVTNA